MRSTEHPLLFRPEMVRSLLNDTKTQTRRLITSKNSLVNGAGQPKLFDELDLSKAWIDAGPSPAGNAGPYLKANEPTEMCAHRVYPRIQVGDRIWVKEAWGLSKLWDDEPPAAIRKMTRSHVRYAADQTFTGKKRSSMLMYRKFARIVLDVVRVRPERLTNIGMSAAVAEGMESCDVPNFHGRRGVTGFSKNWRNYAPALPHCAPVPEWYLSPIDSYRSLWEMINGPGSWKEDPWVWVYEFTRVKP
jgi:hypothetical protein